MMLFIFSMDFRGLLIVAGLLIMTICGGLNSIVMKEMTFGHIDFRGP